MVSELKQVDSLVIKYTITAKFPCSQSDHFTSITTERGPIIFRLLPIKEHNVHSVTFAKYFIEVSNYVLANNVGIQMEKHLPNLSRDDLYECLLRTDTVGSMIGTIKKTVKCVTSRWSPIGLVGRNSALVVLNDMGALNVYVRVVEYSGRNVFMPVVNVTEECIKEYKSKWIDVSGASTGELFAEFKRRLDMHTPTAFTWTQLFENKGEKFAFLIVAYASGRLNFWIFKTVEQENHKDLKCEFMYEHSGKYEKVSYLHWLQSTNGGLLIIAYERGKIVALPIIDITHETFKVCPEIVLYSDADIKVECIKTQVYDEYLFIFVVKLDKLLIFMLSKDGKILDVCNYIVGNVAITGLQLCENKTILVSTLTGVCKELKLSVFKNKIHINWRHLYVSINWNLRRCLGFFSSKNNAIFSFITDASTISDVKKEKHNCHMSNFVNRKPDYFKIILSDTNRNLQEYYDYFEAIRMLGIADKSLNCEAISGKIDYPKLTLAELKLYLYLIRLCEPVVESLESIYYQLRPSSEVQTVIEIKLAIYCIQHILREYNSTKQFTDFMKMALNTLVNYLKEIVVQDYILKYELGDNYTEEVFDVLLRSKDLDVYCNVECSICGNDIFGPLCMNGHYDNRCMLTMIPVTTAKYKCFLCDRFLSIEAVQFFKTDYCVYCDYPLEILSGVREIEAVNHCKVDGISESDVISLV